MSVDGNFGRNWAEKAKNSLNEYLDGKYEVSAGDYKMSLVLERIFDFLGRIDIDEQVVDNIERELRSQMKDEEEKEIFEVILAEMRRAEKGEKVENTSINEMKFARLVLKAWNDFLEELNKKYNAELEDEDEVRDMSRVFVAEMIYDIQDEEVENFRFVQRRIAKWGDWKEIIKAEVIRRILADDDFYSRAGFKKEEDIEGIVDEVLDGFYEKIILKLSELKGK